jgi:hypothetical protein
MNKKNFALLGVAIVSMLMLSWLQLGEKDVVGQQDLLLPGLKDNLVHLEKVEIKTSSESFTLARAAERWVLIEKESYPIEFSTLSNLLKSLSVARRLEIKTSKSANFELLQLDDVSNMNSEAIVVSGFAPEFEFSVVVGKKALNRQAQFVRMAGVDQAWLIDEVLEVNADMVSWLDPIAINIESEQVNRIEQYDSAGSLLFEVERSDTGQASSFEIKKIPSDRKVKYASVADELARSLTNVRFLDVSRHLSSRWKSPVKMRFHLGDDAMVDVIAEKIDGKNWLHLMINDTYEANESVALWDYEVSSYVYENYSKEMEDLLEADAE